MAAVELHLMTALFEELSLGEWNRVFASEYLVKIVNEKNLQRLL